MDKKTPSGLLVYVLISSIVVLVIGTIIWLTYSFTGNFFLP